MPQWIDWLNKFVETPLCEKDIKEWDVNKYYHLNEDLLWFPLGACSFWRSVPLKNGSYEVIKKYYDMGCKIYICTNSHYTTVTKKMENCLFNNLPFLSNDNLIVCKDKQMIKADIIIDDNPKNLFGCKYNILFSAPHNTKYKNREVGYPFLQRANNWKDVDNILSKIITHENEGLTF